MLKWINKKRNQKGFTLIELIVVIAILAILAVIAIPRLTGSRDKANRSAVLASLRSIESAISVAEAEGAFEKIPSGKGIKDILTEGIIEGEGASAKVIFEPFLAKWPEGPSKVKYDVIDKSAAVQLEENQFKFVMEGTPLKTATENESAWYGLENLKEE